MELSDSLVKSKMEFVVMISGDKIYKISIWIDQNNQISAIVL